jgi:hypothetical protein
MSGRSLVLYLRLFGRMADDLDGGGLAGPFVHGGGPSCVVPGGISVVPEFVVYYV